jgi:hypothetical protein
MEDRANWLSSDHIDTITAANALGKCLWNQNKFNATEPLYR